MRALAITVVLGVVSVVSWFALATWTGDFSTPVVVVLYLLYAPLLLVGLVGDHLGVYEAISLALGVLAQFVAIYVVVRIVQRLRAGRRAPVA